MERMETLIDLYNDLSGATESVWREAHTGGFIAEVRGLLNQETGVHDWIRLGVYGSREAAVSAVIAARRKA